MPHTVCFPDPRRTTSDGLLAIGGDLRPETLLAAYRQGIFPWPTEGYPLTWFCPARRAILEFDRLHIPRSLARARRQTSLRFTINANFDAVIEHCRTIRRQDQPGTWITPRMLAAYKRLHRLGCAHSVEVWDDSNDSNDGNPTRLVGGLYGVDADGAFAGESMFHFAPNASKLALLHLIEHLAARGATWIDIQTLTAHLTLLGAREITRDEFLDKLAATRRRGLRLFDGN